MGSVSAEAGIRGRAFATSSPGLAAPATAAHPRRVLVVDGHRMLADAFALLLRMTGHESHIAYDGLEGVHRAGRLHPDAIFIDLAIPQLDAYDTCRLIREQPWGRGVVLVALSPAPADPSVAHAAGFDLQLPSPVDPGQLSALLETLPAHH